jgi:hypothetical protein
MNTEVAPSLSYSTTTNPLRQAYWLAFHDQFGENIGAWEQIMYGLAIRPDDYAQYLPYTGEDGNITLDADGSTWWSATPHNGRSYYDCTDTTALENLIRPIMYYQPPPPTMPTASFTPSTATGQARTVAFTDHSTGYPASWSWDFGDGVTSTAQNPSHAFNTVGTFVVSLTVTNFNGTSEASSAFITVNGPGSVATQTPFVEINSSESVPLFNDSAFTDFLGGIFPTNTDDYDLGETIYDATKPLYLSGIGSWWIVIVTMTIAGMVLLAQGGSPFLVSVAFLMGGDVILWSVIPTDWRTTLIILIGLDISFIVLALIRPGRDR